MPRSSMECVQQAYHTVLNVARGDSHQYIRLEDSPIITSNKFIPLPPSPSLSALSDDAPTAAATTHHSNDATVRRHRRALIICIILIGLRASYILASKELIARSSVYDLEAATTPTTPIEQLVSEPVVAKVDLVEVEGVGEESPVVVEVEPVVLPPCEYAEEEQMEEGEEVVPQTTEDLREEGGWEGVVRVLDQKKRAGVDCQPVLRRRAIR